MTGTTPVASELLPQTSPNWALFLDFDGTLTDIANSPDEVRLSPRLVPTLNLLFQGFGGAVAIVSGRPLKQIDALLAPLSLPTAGLHGLERRGTDGKTIRFTSDPTVLDSVREGLEKITQPMNGVVLEDKKYSLALHYRKCPEQQQQCFDAVRALVSKAEDSLEILPGKMVYEVKPRGMDKGRAVQAFLAEAPFVGRTPLFIGDDVTDEAGFALSNRLGGASIRVGADTGTCAQFRVATVADLLAWLERTANEIRGENSLSGGNVRIG